MAIADEVEIVPLELTDEVLETLLRFDEDSQRINFPKDAPNREATAARIRREYAEEPGGMHLVVHRGKAVGCLFLKTRTNPYRGCTYVDLRNVYVTEPYRGKGVGAKLLAFMEAYARRQGCRYLFLGTGWANEGARKAFESFGFENTRVLMEKDLD